MCNISVIKVIVHCDVYGNEEVDDVLNFICIMGKYHIHKARYLKFKSKKYLFQIYVYYYDHLKKFHQ